MGLPQSQLYEGLYWGPKSLLHFSGANLTKTIPNTHNLLEMKLVVLVQ